MSRVVICLLVNHIGLPEIIKSCLVDYAISGDFGNENVDLVREVSKLDLPKAVILGNHDCWQTVSPFAPYLFVSTTDFLETYLGMFIYLILFSAQRRFFLVLIIGPF